VLGWFATCQGIGMMRLSIITLSGIMLCSGAYADPVGRAARTRAGAPMAKPDPYWVPDYNVVSRYRYRPEDDRVDTSPTVKPVAPADVRRGGFGIGQ
jgi:hypothetical protein